MKYEKDNCVVEEVKAGNRILGIKITPFYDYVLRQKYIEDEEVKYSYIDGYAMIAARNIDTVFPTIEAVLKNGGEA